MKIRTDFVTNSSSYCTTEIIIDNPVLLEILQKYKDMGIFGAHDPIFGIGTYESMDEQFWENDYQDKIKTPAFFYFEKQNDEGFNTLFLVNYVWPESLDKVLEGIIEIIDSADKYLDGHFRTELKDELEQRKDEIGNAYLNVYWRSSAWWTDGESNAVFEFDPTTGSSFIYKDANNVCTTEVAIENPLLLEILQKYKAMGLFESRDPIIGIGEFCSIDQRWDRYFGPELSDVPAFYYYEQEGVRYIHDEYLGLARFCPQELSTVLSELISIMENGVKYLDEKILVMVKEELMQRKGEIDQAYSRVYWSYEKGKEGGKFEYDSINGESYLQA